MVAMGDYALNTGLRGVLSAWCVFLVRYSLSEESNEYS